jgi:hypothetical protein
MNNRYAWFFAMDRNTRTRPLDWSAVIASQAPAQLVAYITRHAQDPRHHWNDPEWIRSVSVESRIDHELLVIRGGAAKLFPGMEVH